MNDRNHRMKRAGVACAVLISAGSWLLVQRKADAHCDTMDGPVVKAAAAALAQGDVTTVLRWVKASDEATIRDAFKQTLLVRGKSAEARRLADRYFFETLVRIHRAGEGEPYTGLKAPGFPIEPAVREADQALERSTVDSLARELAMKVEAGVRRRFANALSKNKRAHTSVAAGREFVEAYVEYVHYVERLDKDAAGNAEHHELH